MKLGVPKTRSGAAEDAQKSASYSSIKKESPREAVNFSISAFWYQQGTHNGELKYFTILDELLPKVRDGQDTARMEGRKVKTRTRPTKRESASQKFMGLGEFLLLIKVMVGVKRKGAVVAACE